MASPDYGIEIRRSGQHPYMPGSCRLSTVLVIALWWICGTVFTMYAVTPTGRNIISVIVVLCLGTGAMWYGGVMLAKDNPFYQENLLRFAVRSLRRRTDLET